MRSHIEYIEPTKAKATIEADASDLAMAKQSAITSLAHNIKVPGFRQGKAPASVSEKYVDNQQLAEETLQVGLNDLYQKTLINSKIRPVSQPQIEVKRYVPNESLEFEAVVEVVGKIKLGPYKGLKIKRDKPVVTAKEIKETLERLQKQLAKRSPVKRAAKSGDEVIIDFDGTYADSKKTIDGASGKDYALELGSKSFIPGFETKLIGAKAGEKRKFEIKFPDDYQASFLKGKRAEFEVTIKQVNAITLPDLNDAFAQKAGPFKNLDELKADIKREIASIKADETASKYQNELVDAVVSASEVDLPKSLLEDEIKRIELDLRQNAAYRGLTWSEFLTAEGLNEESYKKLANKQAEARIKTGLILGEIATIEDIQTSKSEQEERVNSLKQRYASDKAMQDELAKPENIADIRSRITLEKTIQRLEQLNPN